MFPLLLSDCSIGIGVGYIAAALCETLYIVLQFNTIYSTNCRLLKVMAIVRITASIAASQGCHLLVLSHSTALLCGKKGFEQHHYYSQI